MADVVLDVHGLRGFSDKEVIIFNEKVVPLFNLAINSDFFIKRVTEHTFKEKIRIGKCRGKTIERKRNRFEWNRGHSRAHTYDLFKRGADNFNKEEDGDIDVFLTIFSSRSSTIGYTYPNTFKTWVNRKFFQSWLKSPAGHAKIINNLVHEYMHNLGYNHSKRHNALRPYTVPYAYGNIAQEAAERILDLRGESW